MGFKDYWYIVAESHELTADRVLARVVLDERLACFRSAAGLPVILQDRCLHRNAPLSAGSVSRGLLSCPYHGWTYDGRGRVVGIPAMATQTLPEHCLPPFSAVESDGYVYVRLGTNDALQKTPFVMPHYGEHGWKSIRLQNLFANNVSNCVENFIDIPHTAFVHREIFRSPRGERIAARIRRADGAVRVEYANESSNLGSYRWFLNPRGDAIRHTDSFYSPNITSVVYEFGARAFIITSQAVPLDDTRTRVYTDLTYDFGAIGALAAPFIRRHGQRIIDQDKVILAQQMDNIRRYGMSFRDTPADAIHRMVDTLREAIAQGDDPCTLPPQNLDVEFLV
jgi:phenylpropionate dioxygenase-like ring-hydroxylating dioxygenase large terminal subunit